MTRSNEARAKMRTAKLGTKHSAETKNKMSEAQKRRYAENRDRIASDAARIPKEKETPHG